MSEKPKVGMFWAASCGGCEIALVNLHEKILDFDAHFELAFCPCLMDTKVNDVEAMPDGSIAVTLFNGAIRTDENAVMARLLRRKSALLIAFGSCAAGGGIPALSNLHSKAEHLRAIYASNPSIDNPTEIQPVCESAVPEGVLRLPVLHETVKQLADVVEVDYFIPGCPPESQQVWNLLESLISGRPLPRRGTLVGGGVSTVCHECAREKSEKKIARFQRTYELIPDTKTCLIEQGIVCLGIATRDGCGALCPRANMPCTGCYGSPEGVTDQGAKMIAALGSILEIGRKSGDSDEQIAQKIDVIAGTLPDPAGTFYRYSLSASQIGGKTR